MNRIDDKFQQLKKKDEKALITFITAGDPDLETTVELVLAMEKSGADIIELGIPYSDPIADGEVIQASSQRSLSQGSNIENIMDAVKKIRVSSSQVPVLYLVYYNCIFKYGIEKFLSQCSEVGIDGLIIPDLPLEERGEISNYALEQNIHLIPMVAPTSKERIGAIIEGGRGFVYCVSVNGVTGVRNNINTDLKEYMETVKTFSDIPVALGFGISDASMVKKYKEHCDGVIVGSALVKLIAENQGKEVEIATKFVKELKEAAY
ncbi:tryptophan synthase subunit alpha [Clostridium sp. BSD9I1]|uniref:tryptophan synthase subunit alpha n=1 Tax=Clostridium sp. BSD9I1 TaxID=2003589 RepID=UPI0016461F53|nr:tryptophan synthase subunit alpha [Clostridium sp. BSD9I1]